MAVSTGTAILGAAGIGAAGSIAGANAQADSAGDAAALEREKLALLEPYRDAGRDALRQFQGNIGGAPTLGELQSFQFDSSQLAEDPGFQFELEQGQNAIEGSAANAGNLRSGRTLKALMGHSQGLASTRLNEAFNRNMNTAQFNRQNQLSQYNAQSQNYNNTQNQLANLIQGGQTAAGANSSLPQIALQQGQIQADMYGNLANVGTNAMSNYALMNMLQGG